MHDPAERAKTDQPKNPGPDKKQDGREEASLQELSKPGNKKAG